MPSRDSHSGPKLSLQTTRNTTWLKKPVDSLALESSLYIPRQLLGTNDLHSIRTADFVEFDLIAVILGKLRIL
jgi:hypothetical protein